MKSRPNDEAGKDALIEVERQNRRHSERRLIDYTDQLLRRRNNVRPRPGYRQPAGARAKAMVIEGSQPGVEAQQMPQSSSEACRR